MIEKAYGVSVKGQFHLKHKIPNQDYFKVINSTDYTLSVVCDGLGSKKYSHHASKRLCKLVCRLVKKQYKTNTLDPKIFLNELKEKYIKHLFPFSLKNADSTLQIVLLNNDSIMTIKVGDGLIAINGNDLKIIEEDDDNFSNETTSFGKSKPSDWKVRLFKKETDTKVIITTDGIAGDLKPNTLGEFIEELSKCDPKEVKEILTNWPNPHSGDDKTIVVVR